LPSSSSGESRCAAKERSSISSVAGVMGRVRGEV